MEYIQIDNLKDYVDSLLSKNQNSVIIAYKNEIITARPGVLGETIKTYSNGILETTNIVKKDNLGNVDFVATKMIDGKIFIDENGGKNQWIISYDYLNKNYKIIDEENNIYASNKINKKFIEVNENISFLTPWNESFNLLKGGYLNITDLNNIYGIQKKDFLQTYTIVNEIGCSRLAIYELFFNNPPVQHILNKELNILIIGSGWIGNEAFKASFWAGQYVNTTLNITIASSNVDEYINCIRNKLPFINSLANINEEKALKIPYANINVKHVDFDMIENHGITTDIIESLNIKKQNYVIIALGDDVINEIIASDIATNVKKGALVSYFSETKGNTSEINNKVKMVSFKSGCLRMNDSNLISLAKSVNFMYEYSYNKRVNKEVTDDAFDSSFEKEFLKAPKSSDNLADSVNNFIGDNYLADSSLANAVHLSAKLQYCKDNNKNLVQAINENGIIFNTLTYLEHRRWNAYMTIRGFRSPIKNEFGKLYTKGNDHRIKSELIHSCLFESGQNGAVLTNNPSLWEKNKDPLLSELDVISKKCNEYAKNQAVAAINNGAFDSSLNNFKNSFLENFSDQKKEYNQFEFAVNRLKNDVECSYKLYEESSEIIRTIITGSEPVKGNFKKLENILIPFISANKKIDFAYYDSELIKMIPMIYFINENNRPFLCIVENNPTLESILPIAFFAKEITYFMINMGTLSNETITKIYQNHNSKSRINFVNCSIEESANKLHSYIMSNKNSIIFYDGNTDFELLKEIEYGIKDAEISAVTIFSNELKVIGKHIDLQNKISPFIFSKDFLDIMNIEYNKPDIIELSFFKDNNYLLVKDNINDFISYVTNKIYSSGLFDDSSKEKIIGNSFEQNCLVQVLMLDNNPILVFCYNDNIVTNKERFIIYSIKQTMFKFNAKSAICIYNDNFSDSTEKRAFDYGQIVLISNKELLDEKLFHEKLKDAIAKNGGTL